MKPDKYFSDRFCIIMKINIFWFRRDLRLEDNTALIHALEAGLPVLTLFIFDTVILDELQADDPRISFIYSALESINNDLKKVGSSLLVFKGDPEKVWEKLITTYEINSVYINKDYEPYSISRDLKIEDILRKNEILLFRFKDQVIFEEHDILKSDQKPYTLYTPYKNKWLQNFKSIRQLNHSATLSGKQNYLKSGLSLASLREFGFKKSLQKVKPFDLTVISTYDKYRDFPGPDKTSYLGPHLRFGTVSIRQIIDRASMENPVFLSELIWREFFMQILFNFPHVVTGNFRSKYDNVPWRNNEADFDKWRKGQTGFPMVDAGMRQLNETGYMHNRVRMITAGFLCKHLLINWRWGEAYFAEKLLDYELASNNGNWQWAAGTGCDAAQYFRVFNPKTQQMKFDRKKEYIRKWVPEIDSHNYPKPIVDHKFARNRVIEAYKSSI
jgi:deoxyribodipyrimidine photo-lyase